MELPDRGKEARPEEIRPPQPSFLDSRGRTGLTRSTLEGYDAGSCPPGPDSHGTGGAFPAPTPLETEVQADFDGRVRIQGKFFFNVHVRHQSRLNGRAKFPYLRRAQQLWAHLA